MRCGWLENYGTDDGAQLSRAGAASPSNSGLRHCQVPYFNGPIYLENKTQVGKVEEIFGPINASYFTIKMMEGVVATSYKAGTSVLWLGTIAHVLVRRGAVSRRDAVVTPELPSFSFGTGSHYPCAAASAR